jgi:hypothetical protein
MERAIVTEKYAEFAQAAGWSKSAAAGYIPDAKAILTGPEIAFLQAVYNLDPSADPGTPTGQLALAKVAAFNMAAGKGYGSNGPGHISPLDTGIGAGPDTGPTLGDESGWSAAGATAVSEFVVVGQKNGWSEFNFNLQQQSDIFAVALGAYGGVEGTVIAVAIDGAFEGAPLGPVGIAVGAAIGTVVGTAIAFAAQNHSAGGTGHSGGGGPTQ